MQLELGAKHYDKMKSLAVKTEGRGRKPLLTTPLKEKALAVATTLADSLKKGLPDAPEKLSAAGKIN